MKKTKKITDTMQKVAVDILEDLEAYMIGNKNAPKEILDIFLKYKEKYELCDDPFTGTICTWKEMCKNSLEYEKQLMIARYGHCDGLE